MSCLETGFRLGDWRVFPSDGRVERDDESIRLQPKVMAVLVRLAATPGEVVTRNDLLRDVWDGRAVSDEPLNRCIAELRAALGDDRHAPLYIETVPRRGYRLVSAVEAAEGERSPLRAWIVYLAVALFILALAGLTGIRTALPQPAPRLLVLPLVDLSSEESTLLADAMTEELVNSLASQPNLLVLSRRTTFSFRNDGRPAADLARSVRADYVLEGSVREGNGLLRIVVQLIDPERDLLIFSRTLEYPRDNAAELLTDASAALALQVTRSLPSGAWGTRSGNLPFDAYTSFLEAQHLWQSDDDADVRLALARMQRLVEDFPDNARLHALLAAIYNRLYWVDDARPDYLPQAQEHASRALSLDPRQPLALATQAALSPDTNDAITGYRHALSLSPALDDVRRMLARTLARHGYVRDAMVELEKLLERDPHSVNDMQLLARLYCIRGDHARYSVMVDRIERQAPGKAAGAKGDHALHLPDSPETRERLLGALAQRMYGGFTLDEGQAEILVAARFDTGARARAAGLIETLESTESALMLADRFRLWSFIGETDRAINVFLDSGDNRFSPVLQYAFWARHNEPLRTNPRFPALMSRFRMDSVLAANGGNDFCEIQDTVHCR